jgi:copper resistance protein D
MVDLLVATRMVQFASSIVAGGGAMFFAAVAGAGRDPSTNSGPWRDAERQLDGAVIAAVVVAIASGALWLGVFLIDLQQIPAANADSTVTLWSVLTDTQFGRVSALRLLLAVLLAGICGLRFARPLPAATAVNWIGGLLGLALVVSLAWCGHAGSGIGPQGDIHLAADIVHLAAAAVWVGGLVPLLIFLRPRLPLTSIARVRIVRRFSTLAIWSVVLLVLSGLANTWFMTGGIQGLIGTDYGTLVLLKIAILIVMLGFAALNRFRLTPRLAAATGSADRATALLWWSIGAELTLGLIVIWVVAVLGQTEPPAHMHQTAAPDGRLIDMATK